VSSIVLIRSFVALRSWHELKRAIKPLNVTSCEA
jgi:hypothetical protein